MGGRYQGVVAYVGEPGQGKTYALAELGLRAMAAGLRVYSNAGFDLEGSIRLSSFQDFLNAEGPGLIVWDEMPLYFNARDWKSMPGGALYKFTQVRKYDLRLAYSTMEFDMVDKTLRTITRYVCVCSHNRFKWFSRKYHHRRDYEHGSKPDVVAGELRRPRQEVFDAYDTRGRVAIAGSVLDDAESNPVLTRQFAVPTWEASPSPRSGGDATGGQDSGRTEESGDVGHVTPSPVEQLSTAGTTSDRRHASAS